MNPNQYLSDTACEANKIKEAFIRECANEVIEASRALGACFASGGRVFIFGNGGSAADAQHMAAELTGRLMTERRPLPALALTTDTSALTAIANDYGYEFVFSRQLEAFARTGDVIIAISTSGNSASVIRAVDFARQMGCGVIGLTGGTGGELKKRCDILLNVSLGKNSCRIQEVHIFAIHLIVDLLDRYFLETKEKK